jgi:hypothetical protein
LPTLKIYYDALAHYIKQMGGQLYVDRHGIVNVYLPIVIEEVPGGVQYHLIGRIQDEHVIVEKCIVMYEDSIHEVDPSELEQWASYVNSFFHSRGKAEGEV